MYAKTFSIDRYQLAQMIAAHLSGHAHEVPQEHDFDEADKFIEYLDNH